jgi:hypothetical protein
MRISQHLFDVESFSLFLTQKRIPCGWHFTCNLKKGYRFSYPQPGCHYLNPSWPGITKLFPARERLVCDIPARDGKNYNLFYSEYVVHGCSKSG